MRFYDADSIHSLLAYPDLIQAFREAHRQHGPDAAHMVRDDPAGGDNKFVVLVGWQGGCIIAVKMVGVFPANLTLTPPQPSVQGLVAVFDAATGAPVLAADGAAMTFRKTAADSALGASYLARPDARVLLVVGAGGLAPHVLEAHRAARPSLDRVLVWNRTHHRAEALARAHADRGYAISAVSDLDQAVAEADVISCVTMSDAPLVKGALLKPGAHLDLVGAYLPTMREADDDAMAQGSIFVDTRSGMVGAGDLCQPVQRGRIAWSDVRADLFDLCTGRHPGRTSSEEITVFKNVGGGHLDLFAAQCLRAIAGRAA